MRNLLFSACLLSIFGLSDYVLAQESELKEQVAQIQTQADKEIAEDGLQTTEESPINNNEEDIENLDFSIPLEENVYVDTTPHPILPSCNDKLLIELVESKAEQYYAQHPATTIMERRNQKLLLKYLSSYQEVSPKGFTSKQNYNVANHLLMTKINLGLNDDELRLCKNSGQGNASDIYLLIYPKQGEIQVSIINFIQNLPPKQEFLITYPQKNS